MKNSVGFRLEWLPNELILELMTYFQTWEIFQSFYNLNQHWNYLIQSLIHLSYSTEKFNDRLSQPYIRTLTINTIIREPLSSFNNIRRLILDYVTDDLISQLSPLILPYLEYLAINHRVHPYYMTDLRHKIFSNTFPILKSCSLSRIQLPQLRQPWSQTLSLQYLKLNEINAFIYLAILRACPNLYVFKFKLPLKSPMPSNKVSHPNLKRLMMNMNSDRWPWDDEFLRDYFLCLPNLEQLRISRSMRDNDLQDYDWCASIINTSHFRLFERFQFDLYVNRSYELVGEDWKKRFSNVHQDGYESRLVVF